MTGPTAEGHVRAHVLDVSSYQPHPVWSQVKASAPKPLVAVWVKCSQGVSYRTPYRAEQVSGARRVGLSVGGYHFAEPGTGSGVTQADFFLSSLPKACDVQPMLDLEWNEHRLPGPGLQTWIHAFCERVHGKLGRRPLIYCSPAWWGENVLHPAGLSPEMTTYFGNRRLWIAHYDVAAPTIPPPWTHYTLWQHSASTHRDGVGTVDDSYLALALDRMRLPRLPLLRSRRA